MYRWVLFHCDLSQNRVCFHVRLACSVLFSCWLNLKYSHHITSWNRGWCWRPSLCNKSRDHIHMNTHSKMKAYKHAPHGLSSNLNFTYQEVSQTYIVQISRCSLQTSDEKEMVQWKTCSRDALANIKLRHTHICRQFTCKKGICMWGCVGLCYSIDNGSEEQH